MNIIADIAGRYDELMLLLAQMPQDEPIILVGDLVDRGPKSKEVIEWAMTTPNVITIKGNHEDMMVDFALNLKRYEEGIWFMNGGNKTMYSYGCMLSHEKPSNDERIRAAIPKKHIEWLQKLPIFYREEGLFVSHAPWNGSMHELGHYTSEEDALWHRYQPKKREGIIQIFGHNSSLRQYGDYAICIDDSSRKKLTGIHWPSKKIYQQDYLNQVADVVKMHKAPEDR